MTQAESFIAKLARFTAENGWQWELRGSAIRLIIESPSFNMPKYLCPLTAVHFAQNGEYLKVSHQYDAAKLIGVDAKDARIITHAADANPTIMPDLISMRKQLLEATGATYRGAPTAWPSL